MSRSRHIPRIAVVALTLVSATLAACADSSPTAPRGAAASHVAGVAAADSAAESAADSLALPPACSYAPDSARIDSTGVDPEALAGAVACRDSVILQHPFDYPTGDAFELPEGVSLVGAITGAAAELPPEGAEPDTAAAVAAPPCAGADTVGVVGPASVVVCLTLHNAGRDTAQVTFAPGLVLVAEPADVQHGVVLRPIAVSIAPESERRV